MSSKKTDVTTRISAEALRFCQINQQAYEAGLIALKKIVELADQGEKEQTGFANEAVINPDYANIFTPYFDGKDFSSNNLAGLLVKEHNHLIFSIVSFLNSTYNVKLAEYKIQLVLIPEDPRENTRCRKEDLEAWENAILNMRLNYKDILKQVFVQTGDKDLVDQSMEEVLDYCKIASINYRTKEKTYTIQNGTIVFEERCSPTLSWNQNKPRFTIPDNMKAVMKAANMFSFDLGPLSPLYYPFDELCACEVDGAKFYASDDMGRLKAVRLYKNGRLDLVFTTSELAKEFAVNYLGEPA